MKFCSAILDGRSTWGRVDGDRFVDLGRRFPSLRGAIEAEALGSLVASATDPEPIALSAVRFQPVVSHPSKIICVGLNYHEHRVESHNPELWNPTLFIRWPDTLIGSGEAIVHPPETAKLDYEGELAVIIGRGGRRISRENAMDHVAGYACFNDVSVRDWQKHTTQMTPGKNFPATAPFGPWMATVDEAPEVGALRLTTRLNGAIVQDAHVSELIFDIPTLIAYISTFTTLSPGDVIVTGTPGGVGFRREPQLFMKPGDVVEVEITGLGVLRNQVLADA